MRDALAFLTVLPSGSRTGPPGRAAVAAFPLVGLLIGALWWVAGSVGTRVWGPMVGAVLVLIVDAAVTGGLHIDGLADEADGIACRLPPDQAVAVMREGAVGAVGAAAAAMAVVLRFALVSAALSADAAVLLAVPVAGRFAMVWTMAVGRPHPGPSLAAGVRTAAAGVPLAVAAASAAAVGYAVAGAPAIAGLACGCAAAQLNGRLAARRFGGVTGDVVGAGGLLAETVALAVVLI